MKSIRTHLAITKISGFSFVAPQRERAMQRDIKYQSTVFPRKRASRIAMSQANPEPESLSLAQIDHEQSAFLRWVLAQGGLDLRHYRLETLQRRLPSCLRILREENLSAARRRLESNNKLLQLALNTLLLGVTSFFRDDAPFTQLNRQVLPQLAQRHRELHVWSIGCSDGSELYSVAMLLAEQGLLPGAYLLGTDCRPEAIAGARAGIYNTASMNSVPPAFRNDYFHPHGNAWRICEPIRETTRWWPQNVLDQSDLVATWDLILCRNMAMYLSPPAAEKLWLLLERSLRTGGFLIVGKAERPTSAKRLAALGPSVFQRVKG